MLWYRVFYTITRRRRIVRVCISNLVIYSLLVIVLFNVLNNGIKKRNNEFRVLIVCKLAYLFGQFFFSSPLPKKCMAC